MRKKQVLAGFLLLSLVFGLLTGCGKKNAEPENTEWELRVAIGEDIESFDPIYTERMEDQTILAHLYENLMVQTEDAEGKPVLRGGMAKDYKTEENTDGTVTYVFNLRDAEWTDGKKVTANDFVYAWQRLANPSSNSPYATLLSIVSGYQEARNSGDMTLLQVTAAETYQLKVTLDGKYDWFLKEVCTSTATMPLRQDSILELKEEADALNAAQDELEGEEKVQIRWWYDPTKLETNGPYIATSYAAGRMTLKKNPAYGETEGPDSLEIRVAETPEAAWRMYERGDVDLVWPLPEEEIQQAIEEGRAYDLSAELSTYCVLFNENYFPEDTVRQALSMAIDRNEAAQLTGIYTKAAEGLIPPCVTDGTDSFRKMSNVLLPPVTKEEQEEKLREAQEMMTQAGYSSGVAFGTLQLLYLEEEGPIVAESICQVYRDTFHMDVEPLGCSKQDLWTALRSGRYALAAVELSAVSNDAECFLMNWTSDNTNNVIGYESSAFDTLMKIISRAEDGSARMGCLHDAEELLIGMDNAIAPVYNRFTAWGLRNTFQGVYRDARGFFRFQDVVQVDPEEAED